MYSSTATTNLQSLQNNTSLSAKDLIEVGIVPQYNESSLQLGQQAKSFIIPNSFFSFIFIIEFSDILETSRNYTRGKIGN